jgi:hypothetical protein
MYPTTSSRWHYDDPKAIVLLDVIPQVISDSVKFKGIHADEISATTLTVFNVIVSSIIIARA